MAACPRAAAQQSEKIPVFGPAMIRPVGAGAVRGTFAYGLAAAPALGGDGFPDLAVTSCAFNWLTGQNDPIPGTNPPQFDKSFVSIYVNSGNWSPDQELGFGTGPNLTIELLPQGIALGKVEWADVDNDGLFDLIVASQGGLGCDVGVGSGVFVIRQNGTGGFLDSDYYCTPLGVRGLAIADLNNDGLLDIASATDFWEGTPQADYVFIHHQDPANIGTFLAAESKSLGKPPGDQDPPMVMVAADFHRLTMGPSRPDLVTGDVYDTTVTLLKNITTGSSSAFLAIGYNQPDCGPVGSLWNFEDVTTGRYTLGSTHEDVAGTNGSHVSVLHGNSRGDFFFDCPTDRYLLSSPGACPPPGVAQDPNPIDGIDTGHLNGGTRPDLLATLSGCRVVAMLLGTGDGKFQFATNNPVYYINMDKDPTNNNDVLFPMQVLAVDLNQDGFDDVVTANHHSGNVSIARNRLLVTIGP